MVDIKRQEEAFQKINTRNEKIKLIEEFQLLKNYSFSRDYECENSIYAHIHYGDIHSYYTGVIHNKTKLKNILIPEKKYSLIKEGDIVLADASEDYKDLGKSIYIESIEENISLIAGLHTFHLRSKEKNNALLFYQFTKSDEFKSQMSKVGTGISVFGISKSNLEKIQIKNYTNSKEIANFLTSLDSLIQKQEEYIEELKVQKKGYSQKIFNQELRFKGFEDEWITTILGNHMFIPKKQIATILEKGKILRLKLHRKGLVTLDAQSSIDLKATKYYIRKSNDIIYGKQNLFNGSIDVIPLKYNNYLSSGDVPVLRCKDTLNEEFLLFNIGRKEVYENFEKYASGTGSKRIHEEIFLKIRVDIPILKEQQKIATFLSTLDKSIELQEQKLEQLKLKKKYYLNKIFQ